MTIDRTKLTKLLDDSAKIGDGIERRKYIAEFQKKELPGITKSMQIFLQVALEIINLVLENPHHNQFNQAAEILGILDVLRDHDELQRHSFRFVYFRLGGICGQIAPGSKQPLDFKEAKEALQRLQKIEGYLNQQQKLEFEDKETAFTLKGLSVVEFSDLVKDVRVEHRFNLFKRLGKEFFQEKIKNSYFFKEIFAESKDYVGDIFNSGSSLYLDDGFYQDIIHNFTDLKNILDCCDDFNFFYILLPLIENKLTQIIQTIEQFEEFLTLLNSSPMHQRRLLDKLSSAHVQQLVKTDEDFINIFDQLKQDDAKKYFLEKMGIAFFTQPRRLCLPDFAKVFNLLPEDQFFKVLPRQTLLKNAVLKPQALKEFLQHLNPDKKITFVKAFTQILLEEAGNNYAAIKTVIAFLKKQYQLPGFRYEYGLLLGAMLAHYQRIRCDFKAPLFVRPGCKAWSRISKDQGSNELQKAVKLENPLDRVSKLSFLAKNGATATQTLGMIAQGLEFAHRPVLEFSFKYPR